MVCSPQMDRRLGHGLSAKTNCCEDPYRKERRSGFLQAAIRRAHRVFVGCRSNLATLELVVDTGTEQEMPGMLPGRHRLGSKVLWALLRVRECRQPVEVVWAGARKRRASLWILSATLSSKVRCQRLYVEGNMPKITLSGAQRW